MRHYTIDLAAYGITPARLLELRGFCLQYPDKLRSRLRAPEPIPPGMPRPRTPGDPTAQAAVRNAVGRHPDCLLIDRVAEAVCADAPGLVRPLLRHVCYGDSLRRCSPPCSEKGFLGLRKRFFAALDGALRTRETRRFGG